MSSHHPSEPSSAASTPRSEHHLPPPSHRWHHLLHHYDGGAGEEEEEEEPFGPRVRLMCSFGGRILPRPHDHQLRYVGGETRIVAVARTASFAAVLSKLAKFLPGGAGAAVQVKYQLPHEDLDALISVTSDDDVEIMMEEHERLAALRGCGAARTPRLRLFLFPPGGADVFGSLHDGGDDQGSMRERWFVDALNGDAGALERGRSEASSVVSEQPDYLFGLDSTSDQPEPVRRATNDPPESPVRRGPNFPESPVHRGLNDPSEPPIPDLRPLKTKPAGQPNPPLEIHREISVDRPVQQTVATGYPGSQTWQYVTEPPGYFVPTTMPQQQAVPVPFSLHMSYGSQPGSHGPVPMVFQHPVQGFNSNPTSAGPLYVGGLPMAQAGPVRPYGLPVSVPECYSLPTTMVHGPVGGPGVVVPVNPTPGVAPREVLRGAANKGEQGFL